MLFFFQAEDGIRDLVRSRGLGDVYKRQTPERIDQVRGSMTSSAVVALRMRVKSVIDAPSEACLLYTSDAADERSSVDLGGRRIIKKKDCLLSVTARMSKTHMRTQRAWSIDDY